MQSLIWIAFILWAVVLPIWRMRQIERARLRAIVGLQARRGTRVISLIHRQEALSFLGIPLARFINIEDSEQVLRAIRLTPPEMPIDLILHTPGGLVLAADQIARAVRKHPARVTVIVPHYAMSGGTLIALAADEILMDENAVLGPIDPQIGGLPAVSILRAVERKNKDRVDDKTLVLADVAEKALYQMRETVRDILADKLPEAEADRVAEELTGGRWTHDYPIGLEQLQALGLPARGGLPRQVYELMELFPQPTGRRPSVQYVPVETPVPDFRRAWW